MVLFAYLSPYIITFLGMTYSNEGYQPNYFLTCLFLENYHSIFANQLPNVMPLPVFWSLCVEEHFYILWGLLLYFVDIKKLPALIVLFLMIPVVSRYFFIANGWFTLDLSTNIDFFMYGAIPAYLYVNYKELLMTVIAKVSNYLKAFILFLTCTILLFYGCIHFENDVLIESVVLGILFSLTIFIFLPSKNIFKIADENIFSKLGLFTYSLYLIHIIIISFLKKITLKWHLPSDENGLLFFACSLILTIFASYISYHYFEKPFFET